ncbi:hypothetical protein [Aeromonas phage 4L372D]|uniref:Uncharacterized protein n=1 Tax=Aeromonas phage 4L372D TaxID=2588518 RepID=A0A5B9N3I2_9CAUD|nr:hypothetical protein HWC27_gp021 [Aeromonas phage 4L372D]YP_009846574.1 hypothetical protein HWC27_gp026 [Aeromonas phage 4L372D]YP_009846791.1 hypothetical protein HWC27_gp148 [Aeromonas phage 4L372D]QEG08485.1 hypothetical protein [Aeromonas phage 4L372D]QEG08490.1 hypothetical protein [Aeromonas phage 4L372D]QEG08707.1 hypothetical protein [Aeromonas phage 4L372D]
MLTFKNKLKSLTVEQLEQLAEHFSQIEDHLLSVVDLVDEVEIISDHIGYSFSMIQDSISNLYYDVNSSLSDKVEGCGR